MSYSFSYPNNPYAVAKGSTVDISRVALNEPLGVAYSMFLTPLPTGLSITSANGNINGIPTVTSALNNYSVEALGSFGVKFADISLNVLNFAFNYLDTPYTYTKNTPVSIDISQNVLPNPNGIVYKISSSLPSGMTFDASNGHIGGTPTATIALTTYTVDASFNAIDVSNNFQLSILTDFSFYYPETPYSLATGQLIDISNIKVNTEEPNTVYSILPALPSGLTIDASNGRISGNTTFSSISPSTTYNVLATFPTGSVNTDLNISVNFLPAFTYPNTPYILQQNNFTSIVPVYLISNIQGITYSLVSSPLLSDISMNLRSTDGLIFGTPDIFSIPTNYTIRANNGGIIYDTIINLSVQTIPVISYPLSLYILTQGVPFDIFPNTSIYNTGVTYSIDGCALPTGLIFSTATGEIYGTPSLPTTYRQYIVTVSNIIGSSSFNLTLNVIKVLLAPPVLADNIDTGLCLTNPIMSMRRKAEILKYKKNSAGLTKNQYWALAVQGKGPYAKRAWGTQNDLGSNPNISGLPVQGNTIICNSNPVVCSPTSSSDVPGPVTTLCYDPTVSLIGYNQPNRTRVNIGFKWPQRAWQIGDMGFPVGKAGQG
jgi:hypothetical protein